MQKQNKQERKPKPIRPNLFNSTSPEFNPDALATDQEVECYLNMSSGSIAVVRSRGAWKIPSRTIGRMRRTLVRDVMSHGTKKAA